MTKLTKKEYKELVNENILLTGQFKGRSVLEAESDNELYFYLEEIKQEFKSRTLY
ncbi:hypothetical protein Q4195_18780 [Acinetobacter baumannii]|uniref:hypothetical protein n=1 Tax=Acinetobacter baumannii TaxID=470 RepID=UPI0016614A05|nr:hypothetical protein [Acinetobacter baumannii]MBD0441328.1 hypothetical protein [Acinetobacter baumannii]